MRAPWSIDDVVERLDRATRRFPMPAEAVWRGRSVHMLRLAANRIIENVDLLDDEIAVRVWRDGAVGTATVHALDEAALDEALRRADGLAQAQGGQAPPAPPPLPPQEAGQVHAPARAFDEGVGAARGPIHTADVARSLGSAHRAGIEVFGHSYRGVRGTVVVNTAGLVRSFEATVARASLVVRRDERSGFAQAVGTRLGDVDLEALLERARWRAQCEAPRVEVEPGPWNVLLEPEAVCELLEWMAAIAFTPESVLAGRSFLAEGPGRTITGERVTIADDSACCAGAGLPMPFDAQGHVRRPVTFIEAGRSGRPVCSRALAGVLGCEPTGHAVFDPFEPDVSARPEHVVFAPGSATRHELLAELGRGLWVNRFHYVNGLLSPRRAVMTGLTRDALLLVEDGRVVGEAPPMRFTDSILEAFARIAAVGEELRAVATWWREGGAYVAPPLVIRGLRMTSCAG